MVIYGTLSNFDGLYLYMSLSTFSCRCHFIKNISILKEETRSFVKDYLARFRFRFIAPRHDGEWLKLDKLRIAAAVVGSHF